RDAKHPRAQRGAARKARQIAVDLDEHLLAHLIGQHLAVRHRKGEAVDSLPVAIHHQGQRVPQVVGAQRSLNIAVFLSWVSRWVHRILWERPGRHADKAPSSRGWPTKIVARGAARPHGPWEASHKAWKREGLGDLYRNASVGSQTS